MTDTPTVVITTHNRRDRVMHVVEHLRALPEQPPVVVVDNNSGDGTTPCLRAAFPEITVIELERNLGAAGRNVGVSQAATDLVAFSDDDTYWTSGSLQRAAGLLDAHPTVAVVCARVVIQPDGRTDDASVVMAKSPLAPAHPLPGPRILGFLAGASVVRREAFLGTGGFEPRLLIGAEELLVAVDLTCDGWNLCYVDELEVTHRPARRDHRPRRELEARNRLWIYWTRLPIGHALSCTVEALRALPNVRSRSRVIAAALKGLPWVARTRHVVPPAVCAELRLVDV
jgi:GT2 family glycosyltransferase